MRYVWAVLLFILAMVVALMQQDALEPKSYRELAEIGRQMHGKDAATYVREGQQRASERGERLSAMFRDMRERND